MYVILLWAKFHEARGRVNNNIYSIYKIRSLLLLLLIEAFDRERLVLAECIQER